MLKRIKAALLSVIIVAFCLSLSGCAVLASDIGEFQVPPKLTSEQQGIYDGLEKAVGKNITLKYPLAGDYRSAFITRNLEKNGTPKAVAFYSPSSGAEGPHIAILEKKDDTWNVTAQLSSQGNEIDNIDFADFNGDGNDEIVVGWRSFNSTDLTLMVYMRDSKSYSGINLGTFTKMKTVDMDNDGLKDIMLFQLNSDADKCKSRIISYKSNKLQEIGSCPMDSTVTSYSGLYVTEIEDHLKSVMIDGYKGKDKMITELVYFKDGQLHSPLFEKKSKTVQSTIRFFPYQCMDINNDGKFEIPMPVELPSEKNDDDKNHKWLVRWVDYNYNHTFTNVCSTVMNDTQGYYFTYPKEWGKDITYDTNSTGSTWSFYKWDNTNQKYGQKLFSIVVFRHDSWNSMLDKSKYNLIYEGNGMVYTVSYDEKGAKDSQNLSINQISANFGHLN